MSIIGLPYAEAGFDAGAYYVECPTCGERFHGPDSGTEDAATKDPSALYAEHYVMHHSAAKARP